MKSKLPNETPSATKLGDWDSSLRGESKVDNKMIYESPRVSRLDDRDLLHGQIVLCSSGSGNTSSCISTGNTALNKCAGNGNSADSSCYEQGNVVIENLG